jgi:hypothetical protein
MSDLYRLESNAWKGVEGSAFLWDSKFNLMRVNSIL